MNTILTDDEIVFINALHYDLAFRNFGADIAIARAIEAAVLAKLREQEPVAWHTEDHLTDRSATTYSKEAMQRWKGKGWPVTPLYTHPAPQPADRQRVPDGWKLVPVEPTPEMMVAAQEADMDHGDHDEWLEYDGEDVKRIHRAMLAAAPELLEALELLAAGVENSVSDTYIPLVKARSAIEKATGEKA